MNTYQLSFMSIIAFLAMVSCGPAANQSQVSDSSDEYVEESESEEEDKSQRPSPPRTTTANISGVNITIDYSAPSVKGRKIFGDLEPYDKVWRTGANEATVLTVDGNIKINGEDLPEGQYALFTIPGESEWTVIFNKEPNQWGAFNYNQDLDALRLQVVPDNSSELTEKLSFDVNAEGTIDFAWENVSWSLQVAI